jgi:hypothetical protein
MSLAPNLRPAMVTASRMSLLALLVTVQLTADPVLARADDPALADPRIVNGTLAFDPPTVGALLFGAGADSASLLCSGTLVGCRTFLTAGHCLVGMRADQLHVFLPNAGIFAVSTIAVHPAYAFPDNDVAIVRLATSVEGVHPSPINATTAPRPGTAAEIVGFGTEGGGLQDAGLRRRGRVTTRACAPGFSDDRQICWSFLAPLGTPGGNSNTCSGDSGGPLFLDFGCGPVVAGVTSGGLATNCTAGDFSFDANVFRYRDFISDAAGGDLSSAACGDAPAVGDSGTTVVGFSGTLGNAGDEARHVLNVPAGATALRVALSGRDDGFADFDLYVKAGSPPTTTDFDCAQSGAGQYAFCESPTPAAGEWYVLVRRYAGGGPYQLTATILAPGPPAPTLEGDTCNDANPCTRDDHCSDGQCRGRATPDWEPCDGAASCNDVCQDGICRTLSCRHPVEKLQAKLALRKGSHVDRDRVDWIWDHGATTTKEDFGDPLSSTTFAFRACLTSTLGTHSVFEEQRILPGAPSTGRRTGWRANRRGFAYSDSRIVETAVDRVKLTAGRAGKAKIEVHARSTRLGLSTPLDAGTLTVQLLNDRACWEARFDAPAANLNRTVRVRGD